MVQNLTGLSPREAEFLSRLAASGQSVFRYDEMRKLWNDTTTARNALSRLQRGGWLRRVERGLYTLLPLSAGPDRLWAEDPLLVAIRLVEPGAIAYWSALRFWDLTEQLPRTVFVQSPRRKFKTQWALGGVRIQLVHISAHRFFGLTERSWEGQRIRVTDREKTIVDAADRPDLCGGIEQLTQVLQQHLADLDWPRLDTYLMRFGSGALHKRLGYLVEALGLPIPQQRERLEGWQSHLTSGIVDLAPGAGSTGVINRRWRIRDNLGLAERHQGVMRS